MYYPIDLLTTQPTGFYYRFIDCKGVCRAQPKFINPVVHQSSRYELALIVMATTVGLTF